MSDTVSTLLRRRARTAGAEPLLTWYQPATGARTELSAVTLLNWVDKTSHLLDELDVGPGAVVRLALAEEAPGHWVTAVWELACWQVGAVVAIGATDTAALVVTGPAWQEHVRAPVDVVACSLHPLGLPFASPLPPAVLDYALEVRGQSDVYPATTQPADLVAWLDDERCLTQADLVTDPRAAPTRRLVRPALPWATAHAAVVLPIVTGGSSVVVDGRLESDQLARICTDERVDDSGAPGPGAPSDQSNPQRGTR